MRPFRQTCRMVPPRHTLLHFFCIKVMQNTLKPETAGVIRELRRAELKVVMITGDNLLTAVSVARDCGIVDAEDRVVMVEVKQVVHDDVKQVTDVDDVKQTGRRLYIQFNDAEGSIQVTFVSRWRPQRSP